MFSLLKLSAKLEIIILLTPTRGGVISLIKANDNSNSPSLPLYPKCRSFYCPTLRHCKFFPSPLAIRRSEANQRGSWCDVTSSISPGAARLFFKRCTWEDIVQKDTRELGFVERNSASLSQRIIFRSSGTKTKINLSVIHGFRRKDDSGKTARTHRVLVGRKCTLLCYSLLSDCQEQDRLMELNLCYDFFRFLWSLFSL